ncbi:MAG TPA: hypothetical protein VLL52_23195 [Anaerolineae bacterium]|nr:hypothetical protein [Anaerolineae bacterium]
MSKNWDDILITALDALDTGQSIDQILTQCPAQYRDELLAVLQTAVALQQRPLKPARQPQAKQNFLAAAQKLQQAPPPRIPKLNRPSFSWGPPQFWGPLLRLAGSALLLLLLTTIFWQQLAQPFLNQATPVPEATRPRPTTPAPTQSILDPAPLLTPTLTTTPPPTSPTSTPSATPSPTSSPTPLLTPSPTPTSLITPSPTPTADHNDDDSGSDDDHSGSGSGDDSGSDDDHSGSDDDHSGSDDDHSGSGSGDDSGSDDDNSGSGSDDGSDDDSK